MSNLEKRRKMHKLLCDGLINFNGNRADGIPFAFDIPDHIASNPTDAPHKFSLKNVELTVYLGNWGNTLNVSANDMVLNINNNTQFFANTWEESIHVGMQPQGADVKSMVTRANFKAKRGVDVDHAHITVGARDLRSSPEKATHEIMTDLLRGGTDIEIFWYNKYVDGLR